MNLFDLTGKTAVVTGGSRGIGRSIALGLASAGGNVVVAARNEDLLRSVVAEIKGMSGEANYIRYDAQVERDIFNLISCTVDLYGKIDILVNNAGISPYVKKSEELTKEMWDEIIRVNLTAPFLLSKEAGKIMIQNNWGRIINIASVGGIIALPRQLAYCVTKGGIIQMTKVLAVEWATYNVTVNAIAPGYVATDLTAGMRASEKISKNLLEREPIGRFGEPDEIVTAALYLASEYSSFTTGSVLIVDGGMTSS